MTPLINELSDFTTVWKQLTVYFWITCVIYYATRAALQSDVVTVNRHDVMCN